MEQILSNSLIYRALETLRNYFIASETCKILVVLLNWCRNSAINKFIMRYLAKNSSLKHSLTYRIFYKLYLFFDRLWDRLYHFGARCGKSSRVISGIRDIFVSDNSFLPYGLIVLFFSIGFAMTSLILGTFGTLKAAFAGMGIVISLLLFIGKTRWTNCLKGSIFWRFVLYIFD